jgi:serine/threonine-protein kinase
VHSGENARQIMIHAATEPARSLETIMPELPAAVVAIVSRALAFERENRWQSAAEMRDAVLESYRQLFGGEPVRADIAELLARTSASVGSQPTEPHPFADGQRPAASLQTTASTPITTRRPAPQAKARWALFLVIPAGALLAIALRLTLWPAAKSSASRAPVAVSVTVETPRPSTVPSPAPAPSSEAPARALSAAASSAPPFKRATASASPRTAVPRVAAAVSAAPTAAPIAASRAPENPLKLELQ